MRDLDFTSLRLFVTVCDTRNMARAGEQSNLVGSAISKRLAQLEDTVGTPLLVRRRRGVEPTPAGEALLEHARAMLASARRIESEMAAFAAGIRGQVRLLATVSVMAESLADDVADFLQIPAHADIQVNLEERISPEVVRGVREGVASLGICWDAALLDGLQSQPYRGDRLAIVVHHSHPLARHTSLQLAQALDFEFVSLPASTAVQVMLQREAARLGKTMAHRVIVSNFEAALRVVAARLAISVVPAEIAAPVAAMRGLRVVPLEDPWAWRRFAICYRDAASLSPAAALLLQHLQSQARLS